MTPTSIRRHLVLAALLLLPLAIAAQTPDAEPWLPYYEQLIDLDATNATDIENAYEQLAELSANKLNLNTATRQDLEQIFFLTPQQIEGICEYVYKYGPVRTIGELAMVESLDAVRRQLLSYFIYIDEEERDSFPTLANILKYGRNELVAAAEVPLYERKGDKDGYLGYKYKHWFRYTFKLGQHVQAGITGAQDAGEPFFANKNKWGYDHYSFYVLLRKMGRTRALAVGRYRLKLAMGLIMNNDFAFGKTALLTALNSNNNIRGHSSRSASNYLQGAAATINVAKGLDITAFASYRKIDATLATDSSTITTIVESGYHRTEAEMARKHNSSQTLFGANARYFKNGLHIGITAMHTSLDKRLQPNTSQIYRKYYAAGKHFTNASIDYGYINHKLSIDGETAIDGKASLATINRITFNPSTELSLTLLQRFYSYKFETLFGQCFNDGGRVQNESGVYLGLSWTPTPDVSLMCYFDYTYFPWAKFQISTSSHSIDNYISGTYTKNNFFIGARYRLRLRQIDNDDKSALISRTEHRGRINGGYDNGTLRLCTQIDLSNYNATNNSFGWMISQNISYKYRMINAYASLSYFDTNDYYSRIYCYERGLLYDFSFPAFYGNGIRYTFNVRANLSKQLMIICKVGTTNYFDRKKISSSYQEIDGSSKTDLEAQIKWQF